MIKVVIEIASESDLPLSRRVLEVLEGMGVPGSVKFTRAAKAQQDSDVTEGTGKSDIYSDQITIQQRVKQYLDMRDEAGAVNRD